MDVDTGQLLGVAIGGLIAAGTAWLTTSSTTRASREMAREQRAAAQAEASQRYLSETLHELQLGVLQLMRGLGEHADKRLDWEDRDWDEGREPEPDDQWRFLRGSQSQLIDAMAVVEILCSRLGDDPAVDPATNLRSCASDLITDVGDRFWKSETDRIQHVLDEGLAMGQAALELIGPELANLPPPTTYRPLAPSTVRPPEPRSG